LSSIDEQDWWRPVGGSASQKGILERRSLVWNDSDIVNGMAPPANYTQIVDKGKFFTRGCRGMIEQIQVYCIRTGVGTLWLRYSPHPCLGPVNDVMITPGATWAWVPVNIEEMWDYDSLFIWVDRCSDDVSWAYDAVLPYDGHETADGGLTWADMAIRPFFRVVYTGQTPGDVPVSGIVNTVEIPNVAGSAASEFAVNVPHNAITEIVQMEGTGTLICAALGFETSVAPTAGAPPAAVIYDILLYVDGVFAMRTGNRDFTQSCVATSGRAPDGVFYQCSVADPAWDETVLYTILPLGFRHNITLYAYQTTGGAVDVEGTIYANRLA